MIDHDDEFLRIAQMVLEGKEPPKKDKKKGESDDAKKVLDKVKKDVGAGEDGEKKDKGKDGKAYQADDDGALDPDDGEGHDGDVSDHPDDPDETGGDDPSSDKETDNTEVGKKTPKKLDLSKDPFKGEKPGRDKEKSEGSKKSFGDDKKPDGDDQGEAEADPKGDKGEDGGDEDDSSGGDPGKTIGNSAHEADDDSKSDPSGNKADGADKGKKLGKETPGDDESDSEAGESPGEVVDGSSESEINVTPKIEDEEISEGRKVTFVEKARAARLRMLALHESRLKTEDMVNIERALDEGIGQTVPGEWFLQGDDYHVAVMTDDGIRDYVFEKHIGFDKLKGELSHEKGVQNPGALARWIGDRKYGKKKMAKAAKEHKPL